MENKAPGTDPRAEGYTNVGGKTHENFFHPKQKSRSPNIQRAGLRYAYRVGMYFSVAMIIFVLAPTHLGPFYVNYVASNEWVKRATKSIWQRRNEKDHELYMTQRKNTWTEWLGLKHYDISSEENPGDIQKYR